MKKKIMLLLTCLFIGIGTVTAQTQKVSGVVISEEDMLPVIGAFVLVNGTSMGAITDVNGNFTLSNVPSSATTLQISYTGMMTQEVAIQKMVKVILKTDAILIEDVVVTGYGVTKKAAFTGSATTIGRENIINKTDANPIKALDGTVPGLQMNLGSGQPGAPATIFIRGRNSINSGTQPLYIVDGVPFTSDVVGARQSEGKEISPLSNLSANDIESITVLKDATATSIYGARAANGVIVITTKKGQGGKTRVNFSAKLGAQMMPNSRQFGYQRVGVNQYLEMWNEALSTKRGQDYIKASNETEGSPTESIPFLNWYIGNDSPEGTNTNWLKEITRTGFTQEYAVDIQGGSSDLRGAKYYLSLSYLGDEAIISGKDLNRYLFRFNFDQAPSQIVKFGFNTNFTYSETNMGAGGGYYTDPITQAYMQSPLTSVKTSSGEWNFNTINGYNPAALRSENGDQNLAKQYRALLSPYLQLNITPDIYLMSRAGADIYFIDEFDFMSFKQPQGMSERGMGENSNTSHMLFSITNTFNYVKTIHEKHNVNFLLGQETQYTYLKSAHLAGSNYPVDFLPQVSNTAVPSLASTTVDRVALASFFANAQYDFSEKYYLSGSFRMDGSSRFGKNNRWAPFWSVGAKYRISSENFMSTTENWLENLTLRASYGTSGNQEVGGSSLYAARDLYGFGYNYNGIPGSSHVQFGNPDLTWEMTKKLNVGLDITFLKHFSIGFDYYNHRTTDMVFAVPTSMVTGLTSYYKNVGELKNRGFEVSLSAQIISNRNLTWSANLNGSKNSNEVVKLSTDSPIEESIQIIEVGHPLTQFKMKEWAGVDPATGNGTWYLNADGDEITTEYNKAAKRYFGSANPKFFGSMGSNLSYHGFDFSFQLNYSLGGKIYGRDLHYDEQIGGIVGQNFTEYVYKNRWQKPGDVALVPRLEAFSISKANSPSSRFLMDGDYLKIRSLTLGYTLPSRLTGKARISKLRIYVQADNIYTFGAKNYRGFDPSGIEANGIQMWNFTLPRNIVFGVNISF